MPSLLQDDVKQELIDTSEQLITTQAQRDRNAMKLEQLGQQQGAGVDGPVGSQEGNEEAEMSVLAGHLNRIASLEKEVKRLKQVCTMKTCYCSVHARQVNVSCCVSPLTSLWASLLSCSANKGSGQNDACRAVSGRST